MQSDSLDEQLKKLALTAKAHPFKSPSRRRALAEIYSILQKPGMLNRRPGIHSQVWDEVRRDILVYACEKIDNYDPDKGRFLDWVNGNSKWRQHDAEIEFNRPPYLSLDNPLTFGGDPRSWQELNLISAFGSDDHPDFISLQLQRLFEEDPDGRFASVHVKDHPEVTFQSLLLRKIYGVPYREVAEQTGISISTLSSFYQRKLAEFSSYIRDYLRND